MIVPILELEKDLQIYDKTRFSAEKSFATKDDVALTSVKIQPSDAPTPIEVFVSGQSSKNWFLDWVFQTFSIDIDTTLNQIKFTDGSGSFTVSLPTANYTLSALASAIQTLMNGVSSGYAVTVTDTQELKFTNALPFKFDSSDLVNYCGLDTKTQAVEHLSAVLEYLRRRVTVTVDNGTTPVSKDYYLDVYNEYGDRLFSNDQQLVGEEPDILNWVTKGRSSHLNVHRKAQRLILDWLEKNNYRDANGNKVEKWNILDLSQVQQWSQYIALRFIFSSIYNAQDDVFKDKADLYEKYEIAARNRAIIDLDLNNDQTVDKELSPSTWSADVLRR
jgi:hypothetical protein